MLKREIKYKTFGEPPEERTAIYYFNLSEPELVELEVEYEGGMAGLLRRIIEMKDQREIIKQFKSIILMSVGERSQDDDAFLKTEAYRERFSQTAAYAALFMELATNAEAAAIFLKGVMPPEWFKQEEVDKKLAELQGQSKPS